MATELRLGQYEIDGRLVFGTRSPFAVRNQYLVAAFDVEQGDLNTVDSPLPHEDGTLFGEDYRGGMLVSFQMNLWKRGQDARYDLQQLQSVWRGDSIRRISNEVTTLRINKGGLTTVVYGRPRRFKPQWGAVELGWCPIDADFQCVDELFYEDRVEIDRVSLAIVPTPGITFPTTVPFKISQFSTSQYVLEVGGTEPTWIMMQVEGPFVNPGVLIDGERWFKFNQSLTKNDTVTIDPRPWKRMTLKNGTENWAGKYQPSDMPLRMMKLAPGTHVVTLEGTDETLTGGVQFSWRNATTSP